MESETNQSQSCCPPISNLIQTIKDQGLTKLCSWVRGGGEAEQLYKAAMKLQHHIEVQAVRDGRYTQYAQIKPGRRAKTPFCTPLGKSTSKISRKSSETDSIESMSDTSDSWYDLERKLSRIIEIEEKEQTKQANPEPKQISISARTDSLLRRILIQKHPEWFDESLVEPDDNYAFIVFRRSSTDSSLPYYSTKTSQVFTVNDIFEIHRIDVEQQNQVNDILNSVIEEAVSSISKAE